MWLKGMKGINNINAEPVWKTLVCWVFINSAFSNRVWKVQMTHGYLQVWLMMCCSLTTAIKINFLKGQSFVLVFASFLFIKMINSKQRIIRTESENHLEGLSGVIFDSTVCTVLIFFTIKRISIINLSLTIWRSGDGTRLAEEAAS